MATVTITHNKAQIERRIKAGAANAIAVTTEQIVKDSNYYCREDQGTLIASSQTASDYRSGRAVWDTPYARRVFYTGTPSKDKNANASLMWVEKARASRGKQWEKTANKAFKEGM